MIASGPLEHLQPRRISKLQQLLEFQKYAQNKWAQEKIFECDAPADQSHPKYMATFPSPYMSGRLHLGHAFTLSKAQFAVSYHRLKGERVLVPAGFHCTGMPIKSCVDKLKREIDQFGNPPSFPEGPWEPPLSTDQRLKRKKILDRLTQADALSILEQRTPSAEHIEMLECEYRERMEMLRIPLHDLTAGKLTTGRPNLFNLPLDISNLILITLGTELKNDVARFLKYRLVCSQWRRAMQHAHIWRALCDRWVGTRGGQLWVPTMDDVLLAQARSQLSWPHFYLRNFLPLFLEEERLNQIQKEKNFGTRQWNILRSKGIPESLIPKFTDSTFWIKYFSAKAISDLTEFGFACDFRRSFVTTSMNRYYDSFVHWQFEQLRARGKIVYRKRFTIASPSDGQPCGDQDRALGEGALPIEYTGVKMEVIKSDIPADSPLRNLPQHLKYFLLAATLRPETLYGQTNVFLGPEVSYIAAQVNDTDVFVVTAHAAKNLAYQGYSLENGKAHSLGEFKGSSLLGLAVRAPLSTSYAKVYVLPMLALPNARGTGVVASVPSDSPYDWAAFRDLTRIESLWNKFHLIAGMVLPFTPIEVIKTEKFGNCSAITACNLHIVRSQNDRESLALAQDEVYKEAFDNGIMLVGAQAGMKVSDARPLIRAYLIEQRLAIPYAEPSSKVVSRAGDECIVALNDQWCITYGEEEWQLPVCEALQNLNMSEETRNQFVQVLSWLDRWTCSRTNGLGSTLPWDSRFVIDPLSDSTIDTAYSVVAHLLQGDIYGDRVGPLGIQAEQMTFDAWNYVFLNAPYNAAKCGGIAEEKLAQLRREFEFWLPIDIRIAGKGLIANHLTFVLYTHTAIWGREKWPKSFRCCGSLLFDNEKMRVRPSRFMTMKDACGIYGADAVRYALADAGDWLDDANFVEDQANAAILRLWTLWNWVVQTQAALNSMRTGSMHWIDRVFQSQINLAITRTDASFARMEFRAGLKSGFFEMQNFRDSYHLSAELMGLGIHRDLIRHFMQVQTILLSVICPHTAERLWTELGNTGSVLRARWPETAPVDQLCLSQHDYLQSLLHAARTKLKSLATHAQKNHQVFVKPTVLYIFVSREYPPWLQMTISILHDYYKANSSKLPEHDLGSLFKNTTLATKMKDVVSILERLRKLLPTRGESAFALKPAFDEAALLLEFKEFIKQSLNLQVVHIFDVQEPNLPDPDKQASKAVPGTPYLALLARDI